jgi:hypothetical protein
VARDRLLAGLPVRSALKVRDSRNRSGIVGVCYYGGRWVASWYEGGRRITQRFSVTRFGEQRARGLAIKARQEAVRRILSWRDSRKGTLVARGVIPYRLPASAMSPR